MTLYDTLRPESTPEYKTIFLILSKKGQFHAIRDWSIKTVFLYHNCLHFLCACASDRVIFLAFSSLNNVSASEERA